MKSFNYVNYNSMMCCCCDMQMSLFCVQTFKHGSWLLFRWFFREACLPFFIANFILKGGKMDFNFIYEHITEFVNAGILTMSYGFLGIILSIFLGIIIAFIKYFKVPILSQLSSIYIELSRNTPLLVQLFLLYFGLPKLGFVLSSSQCAIFGLTFLGSSYMAESFRAGLESIKKSQIESTLSIGLSKFQIIRYIIFVEALAVSFSGILANVIFLIKETSVFSVVALADLVYVAKDLIGIYYKTDETLLVLVISYLIILLPILIIGEFLERKVGQNVFGN